MRIDAATTHKWRREDEKSRGLFALLCAVLSLVSVPAMAQGGSGGGGSSSPAANSSAAVKPIYKAFAPTTVLNCQVGWALGIAPSVRNPNFFLAYEDKDKIMRKWLGFLSLLALIVGAFSVMTLVSPPAQASGGGGGGGTQAASFSGNWSGTITTSFGTGAFTMRIAQSSTAVSGSVHFGAPIFDATLRLAGTVQNASQLSGTVSNGEGRLPITGTLSADGTTITGTVIQGQVYTYTVTRQ